MTIPPILSAELYGSTHNKSVFIPDDKRRDPSGAAIMLACASRCSYPRSLDRSSVLLHTLDDFICTVISAILEDKCRENIRYFPSTRYFAHTQNQTLCKFEGRPRHGLATWNNRRVTNVHTAFATALDSCMQAIIVDSLFGRHPPDSSARPPSGSRLCKDGLALDICSRCIDRHSKSRAQCS